MVSLSLLVLFAVVVLIHVWASVWDEQVKPRVRLTAEVSRRSIPYGEHTELTVRIENASRLPAPFITYELTLPRGLSPSPKASLAVEGTEPSRGGTRENRVERLTFGTSLKPRERVSATFTLYGTARGDHRLDVIRLYMSDGLSAKAIHRELPCGVTVTVHPESIRDSVNRQDTLRIGPKATRRKLFSNSLDWVDMRPYQAGDSLRDVSWMTSARRGEPIVLQRAFAMACEWVVVAIIETGPYQPHGNIDWIDNIYAEAQSIALDVIRDDARLTVYSDAMWTDGNARERNHRVLQMQGPIGSSGHKRIGHAFGRLPSEVHTSPENLLLEVEMQHRQPAQVVIVTGDPASSAFDGALSRLRRRGHRVTVVSVTRPDVAEEHEGP